MAFTNRSQQLMTHFFDIFESYTKNKKGKMQRETNSIFTTLHNELTVAENVYNDVYKVKVKRFIKEVKSQKDIPVTTLINSKYIHSSIKNKIYKDAKYLVTYNLKLQGTQIEINTLFLSEKDFKNLNKFEKTIDNVFIFLKFMFFYLKRKKPKQMKYYLFLTNNRKVLPKSKDEVIGSLNCNTGITYGCSLNGEVLIYRKEECFKVILHETIHLLCLDFNNLHLEKINQKIKNLLHINSNVNLFESYTEYWANIFHSIFCAKNLSVNYKKDFLLYLDFILTYEKMYSLFQCIKVLKHMRLNYKQLISKDEISISLKKLYYKEESNIFAYYVVKMVLLYYNEEFLMWCKKNNKEIIFNFKKNTKNIYLFWDFIYEKMQSKELIEKMEKMEEHYSIVKGKDLLSNLRMTITSIE